jgi:large subunit ribosomal protein L24
MKLKKGDTVKVTRGKDKGRTGKIEKVFPKKNKILIPGLNLYKKHAKPKSEKDPGGIVEIVKPLPVSNVALVCPKCSQPTRVGYRVAKSGKKQRICKKCKVDV